MTFGWHHRGWRRGRPEAGRHERASLLDEAKLAEMIALTERIIAITPDQRDAWDSLVAALESGAEGVRRASRSAAGEDSVPARLERLEICFTAGLEALRRLTPALDAFYHRLDDRQREVLDLLATPAGPHDGAHQAAG